MSDNQLVLTIVFTTLVILLLIAGVVITLFISRRRAARQQMAMTEMELGFEKELRNIQEQTMTHISQELHDNVNHMLATVHLQLEKEKFQSAESRNRLGPASETLREAIQQIRLLSHTLNNDFISDNGIAYTIEQEIKRLQQIGLIPIHWSYDRATPLLTKDQSIVAFRIFQQVISNALKHADAGEITVSLKCKDRFELSVEDDGTGFDPHETMQSSKGIGFKNMLRRAELAQLKLTINSTPGKGSHIVLVGMYDEAEK